MVAPGHIVLIGLMASGKTTVGQALANRLQRPFVDNDAELTREAGRNARALEDAEGVDALHRAEARVLGAALERPEPAVIAAAAAAVLEPGMAARLRGAAVVYLRTPPAELAARVAAMPDDRHRPFGGRVPLAVLQDQFAARDETYRELAALVVDTGSAPDPADAVRTISDWVGR